MPNENGTLHYGGVAGGNIRGVTGLGFMEQANIYTLECEVLFDADLPWRVRAEKSQVPH